jgi:ATP diphosphatase
MTPSRDIARLLEIMKALRTPVTGCPWDLEQTFATIAPYTIEEAYEVADAIERGDIEDLKDELGDLLLQVVFHAQMGSEDGQFDFGDVVEAITTKMIRRHPHVFGDAEARDAGMAKDSWERIKAEEKVDKAARKAARGIVEGPKGLLDSVNSGLPALERAVRLTAKAGTVGFDWDDPHAVIAKIREELEEIEAEIEKPRSDEALEEELGDVLFAVANLARHLKLDPEKALRRGNEKFRRRFAFIERRLAEQGRPLGGTSLEEMEEIWQQAKRATRE